MIIYYTYAYNFNLILQSQQQFLFVDIHPNIILTGRKIRQSVICKNGFTFSHTPMEYSIIF